MRKGVLLTVNFKPPLAVNYEDSLDDILNQLMDAIEQSDKYKNKTIG